MFCAFPLFFETEVDLTNSTASPQTLVFGHIFPPRLDYWRRNPWQMPKRKKSFGLPVRRWVDSSIGNWLELLDVVWKLTNVKMGWMDHDDIVCMFHVFLIMYPTAVFVYSLHCMKPTFDCVGGDGYMLGSCVWCFNGSLHETSPTNHKAQVTGIRFNVWASAISMAAWSAWLPRGVHGNGPLECDPKSHPEFV